MAGEDWQNYVMGQSTQGMDPEKTTNIIRGWIEVYLQESNTTIDILEGMLIDKRAASRAQDGSNEGKRRKITVLLDRWKQIRRLCEDALGEIS